MPVLGPSQVNPVTVQAKDIIRAALSEIGVLAAGETADADDSSWGLEKLQRMIDSVNASRTLIYAVNFQLFTLTPNHSPHTIGPGGDFATTVRPTRINSGSFIIQGGSNPVEIPIKMEDHDWWAAVPLKSLTSNVVIKCYYEPDFPLGSLFFYPICTGSNQVRLELWSGITQPLKLADAIALPPGYWDALVYGLAVGLCPSYERQPSAILLGALREAMRIVQANNDEPPTISTADGMPNSGSGSGRPDFNFLTGLRE